MLLSFMCICVYLTIRWSMCRKIVILESISDCVILTCYRIVKISLKMA